jgi:hypothetical protein
MDQEQSYIAGRQDMQPSEGEGKALMGGQEPATNTRQGHLESDEMSLAVVDQHCHEWVGLMTAMLDEEQCQEGIEHRRPNHDEQ